jgi:hypothetical protein
MSDTDEKELCFIDSMALNGPIEDMLKEAIKDPDLEFEWIYGDIYNPTKHPLTKELFLRLKEKLNQSSSYTVLEELNDLDIRTELRHRGKSVTSNIRATLHGLREIKQYCLQDNFDDLTPSFIKKVKFNPKFKLEGRESDNYSLADSGLYPMRSTLKEEIKLEPLDKQVQTFTNKWSSKNKYFRYKKRYSYLSNNKLWRIDLTALKSSTKNNYSKTFKESGLLSKTETFELEIEYVGSFSDTFQLPYIVSYSDTINQTFYDIDECVYYNPTISTDVPNTNTEDVMELAFEAPSSPRYSDGIEFDIPNELLNSPTNLPNKVGISDEYWSDSDNKEVIEVIKKQSELYKFIPVSNHETSQQLQIEIQPEVEIKSKDSTYTVQTILVPYKYILGEFNKIDLPQLIDDSYTPESPRSLSGGGFSVISSENYNKKVIDNLLENLNDIIHDLYSCIVGSEYYLNSLEESDVLKEYIELTDSSGFTHREGWKFVGPQPVSMNLTHLNPLNPHSIVSKYVVTEKADGIRAQLIINKQSRAFLITPKKQVIDTGLVVEGSDGSWIFDGEYITQNINKEPIQLFMIFDVYFSSRFSTQPYTYPWISKKGECRSEIIRTFQESSVFKSIVSKNTNLMRIGFKQYLEGPEKLIKKKGSDTYSNIKTMFKNTKKILDIENSQGYEYFTDGLIFMPMYLPVKGSEEGEIVKSIRGTWKHNYKWKPPEENTIDFKVIFKESKPEIHSYNHKTDDGRNETQYYQKVQLAVEYREKDDSMIDFNWSILSDAPINKQSYQYFTPPEFKMPNIHVTNIPLDRKRMKCLKDGKDIVNGSIVEMRYNPDSSNGFTWSPLRLRDDKIKPQYFTIANNIWNTINDPVTETMIRGDVDFDELTKDVLTDRYYIDTKFAEDSPIRSLHNYIKSKLISRVGSSSVFKKPLTIADLSCGRGGDTKKYLSIRNDVGFILGLDISSNINEAAQRYHYERKPKPPALFLQFDTSQSIEDKSGCLGDITEKLEICDTMLNMIFKKTKSYPKKYKQIQSVYSGIASNGFDIVSSQFSLHYYFKDEYTLRGFCENLKYLCNSGGYFIGTCYDGMKLMKTFAAQDTDKLEMLDSFGSLIYQIKKKYTITDFTYNKEDRSDMYGQEIEVFMASIGQHITEYLVNFEFFIDIMKEYGFKLSLPPFKKGEYNPIKEPVQSFDQIIQNLDELKDRDFNFIKKTRNRDLFDIRNDKGYQLLSGLNNWFIFEKI